MEQKGGVGMLEYPFSVHISDWCIIIIIIYDIDRWLASHIITSDLVTCECHCKYV